MHPLRVCGGLLHHILVRSPMRFEIAIHTNVPTAEMLLLVRHDCLLGKSEIER